MLLRGAMLLTLALVKLIKGLHIPLRFGERQPTALNFGGDGVGLFGKRMLLAPQQELVTLRFIEQADIEPWFAN